MECLSSFSSSSRFHASGYARGHINLAAVQGGKLHVEVSHSVLELCWTLNLILKISSESLVRGIGSFLRIPSNTRTLGLGFCTTPCGVRSVREVLFIFFKKFLLQFFTLANCTDAVHGSFEPPIGWGLICSQETEYIASLHDAWRFQKCIWQAQITTSKFHSKISLHLNFLV